MVNLEASYGRKRSFRTCRENAKIKTRDEPLNLDASTVELFATFAEHGSRIAH